MLHYYFRRTPASVPLAIDEHLLDWPAQVRLAFEDKSFQFRTEQIDLTFNDQGKLWSNQLAGGEEVLLVDDSIPVVPGQTYPPPFVPSGGAHKNQQPLASGRGVILWAGTIDPTQLHRDDDQDTLEVTVLQHGANLNQIKAGKRSGGARWRWQGSARLWRNVYDQNRFNRAEPDEQDSTIFVNEETYQALSDSYFKNSLQQLWRYDSTSRASVADTGAETNFPATYDEHGNPGWLGFYKPVYLPNWAADAGLWRTTELAATGGAYAENPDGSQSKFAFSVQSIVADLIDQYNEANPGFPLVYEPASGDLQPPVVSQAFALLSDSRGLRQIDFQTAGNRLFLVATFENRNPALIDYALYEILNGSELLLLREGQFSTFGNPCAWKGEIALRFARVTTPQANYLFAYVLWRNDIFNGQVRWTWQAVELYTTATTTRELGGTATETLNTDKIFDRSVDFSAGYPGTLSTLAELNPLTAIHNSGFDYRLEYNRVVASGAIGLSAAGFDYTNTTLAKILADLAALTDSVFWVEPDRRCFFKARQTLDQTIIIAEDNLNQGTQITPRTLADEPWPDLSLGIEISSGHRQALQNYYHDTRAAQHVIDAEVPLEKSAFYTAPQNYCLSFNGTSQYVLIADSDELFPEEFSIEFDFARNETADTTEKALFSKGGNTEYAAVRITRQTTIPAVTLIIAYFSLDGTTWHGTPQIAISNDTDWHHLTFVFTQTSVSAAALLRVDATSGSFSGSIGQFGAPWNNSTPLTLAAERRPSTGAVSKHCDCRLDNLRIVNRVVSLEEHLLNWNRGRGRYQPPSADCIAAYDFNKGKGTLLPDLSGRSHDGLLISSPVWTASTVGNPPVPFPRFLSQISLQGLQTPAIGQSPRVQELILRNNHELLLRTRSLES